MAQTRSGFMWADAIVAAAAAVAAGGVLAFWAPVFKAADDNDLRKITSQQQQQ